MLLISQTINQVRLYLTDAVFVTLGRGISALGSLFTVYILTRYLSPSDYGGLNLLMTFSIIATQLFIGPLGAGSTRFYMAAVQNGDTKSYLNSVYHALKVLNGIILSIGCLFSFYLIMFHQDESSATWAILVLLITLFSIITSYSSVFNGLFLAAQSQTITSFYQGIEPWLKVIFAVLIIMMFGSSTLSAISGYILALVVLVFSQLFFINKMIDKNDNNDKNKTNEKCVDWISKIKQYSVPFVLWGGFTSLHIVSDRWALNLFSDLDDVGFYSVLYQIGYFPVTLIIGILIQLVTPFFFRHAGLDTEVGNKLKIMKTGSILIVLSGSITLFISFVFFFTNAYIFEILFTEEYSHIAYLLPYMCIAAGLFATGQAATLILQSEVNTNILLKPKIVTSILGIAFNIIGAFYYGIAGIVIGLICYGVIYLAWIIIITFFRNTTENEVNSKN